MYSVLLFSGKILIFQGYKTECVVLYAIGKVHVHADHWTVKNSDYSVFQHIADTEETACEHSRGSKKGKHCSYVQVIWLQIYVIFDMLFSLKIFFQLLSVSAETWNFCSKSKQKIFIFIQENLKNSMWNWTRTQVLSLLAFYGLSCIYVLLNGNEKVDQPTSASLWLYSRKTRNSKSQPEPDLPGS